MEPQSKFDAILDRKRDVEEEEEHTVEQTVVSTENGKRGRGRPAGKRTNPDYAQVTAYIPKSLHEDVKIALIKEGGKEFSTLVEELLAEWMQDKSG
ncbi:MAG: hypothetical protein ETSY1_47005 (plasmid) [Candidatus Entotheonella factor]|uniref:CopG family transcriptional regulator n=1 Tax=Entotheonella factor TaxID=1429438 RepID=W4M1G2_ENTF1|nr:MAG: hypothetical protein ETSY1_47005 [Candidatus Entotheonella factor]